MGVEKDSQFYNELWNQDYYRQDPEKLRWYDVWKTTCELTKIFLDHYKTVIDLGCGPGHLAQMLTKTDCDYTGYDFSNVAIEQAKARVPKYKFICQDLKQVIPMPQGIYLATEFFEHVLFDLEVISRIPANSIIIFSLPRFDCPGHVRYHQDEESIKKRYSGLITLFNSMLMKDNHRYVTYGMRKG